MKRTILFFSFIGCWIVMFSQNQICVDCNSSSSESGTSSSPYHTIQKAVNNAVSGDVIKVAKGIYSEAVKIKNKKVQLLGGFAGNGDFSSANPQTNKTTIKGTSDAPCILVSITSDISGLLIINGFTICEGERGIELADGWSQFMDNVKIENNIIENNGNVSKVGGGIGIGGGNITIQNNTIRNNKAKRGAAIGRTNRMDNFSIADNLIQDNTSYDDHAGGLDIHGTGTVTRNIFERNRAAEGLGYGWGGAILITNEGYPDRLITLSHNIYRNNHAPDHGGAVFVDDEAHVRMEHELFYNNTCNKSGSAIYVDIAGDAGPPSTLYMSNCTVYGNSATNGAAMFVEGSIAQVENCIFWNNGNDFETVYKGQAAVLTVNYTLTQQGFAGTGNFSSDPLFANPSNGDFHLKSKGGRFLNGEWVNDDVTSPAIDAGNPSSPFSNEPTPNGSRINLGYYGNTAEASKSADVGIEELSLESGALKIYPNPTTGELKIKNYELKIENIEIFDVYGRQIFNFQFSTFNSIDVSGLPTGVYFVRVGNRMAKFVKQ